MKTRWYSRRAILFPTFPASDRNAASRHPRGGRYSAYLSSRIESARTLEAERGVRWDDESYTAQAWHPARSTPLLLYTMPGGQRLHARKACRIAERRFAQ